MGNSRKPKPDSPFIRRVAERLDALGVKGTRVSVGLSGGRDSVVLLSSMREVSAKLKLSLSCIHVHHGISGNADSWEEFCQRLCTGYGVPLKSVHVDISKFPGLGVEAAARAARYAAFSHASADFIALAHHQDDQAETVLVQLLRGGGPKGLSGMSPLRSAPGPTIIRPLLHESSSALERYAQKNHLTWVEDESNADPKFVRNFLRHVTLPSLELRFPGVNRAIARSAQHLAEAQALLDELAQIDLLAALHHGGIRVNVLRAIGPVRSKNLLRYWLGLRGVEIPEARHLEELLRQVCTARPDAAISCALGSYTCRRFQDVFYVEANCKPAISGFQREWKGELPWVLPELGGQLDITRVRGEGLSVAKVTESALTVRLREGKLWFKPDSNRPKRSLKNLFQEHGVPPWKRECLPLIYCGSELAYVPFVGLSAAFRAGPDEEGISISWRPILEETDGVNA